MFSPAKIDEIRNAKGNLGNLMVSLMEERRQINPHDISPLLNALDSLKLYGLVSKTRQIFLRAEGVVFSKCICKCKLADNLNSRIDLDSVEIESSNIIHNLSGSKTMFERKFPIKLGYLMIFAICLKLYQDFRQQCISNLMFLGTITVLLAYVIALQTLA